jgi:hypothetical protein
MAATWARVCLEEDLRPHGGVADTYEYRGQEAGMIIMNLTVKSICVKKINSRILCSLSFIRP